MAHTRLPSVGFPSWSRFLAVSLQVTWVINPAVGYHYFPPGPQLPSQPLREGCYEFRCLVNRGTMGANSLPKTVTRRRRGCDLNPSGPSAPESSTLTTRPPSHPSLAYIQTRLSDHMTYSCPDRAFPVTAARAWNALPSSVRAAPSLLQFRRDLKTALHVAVIVLSAIVFGCVTDCNC